MICFRSQHQSNRKRKRTSEKKTRRSTGKTLKENSRVHIMHKHIHTHRAHISRSPIAKKETRKRKKIIELAIEKQSRTIPVRELNSKNMCVYICIYICLRMSENVYIICENTCTSTEYRHRYHQWSYYYWKLSQKFVRPVIYSIASYKWYFAFDFLCVAFSLGDIQTRQMMRCCSSANISVQLFSTNTIKERE